MKRLLVVLTLAVVLSMTLSTPAFAEGPDKNQDRVAPGLYKAAPKHCCNPGHNGPANAKEVFESKHGIILRY